MQGVPAVCLEAQLDVLGERNGSVTINGDVYESISTIAKGRRG